MEHPADGLSFRRAAVRERVEYVRDELKHLHFTAAYLRPEEIRIRIGYCRELLDKLIVSELEGEQPSPDSQTQ